MTNNRKISWVISGILSIYLSTYFAILSQAQNLETVKYLGAIGNTDWTHGWINYRPDTVEYPKENIVIVGLINKNTTLTKKNTYLFSGDIYVTNNATLFIEPGTVIKFDYVLNSKLIVTCGSKIRAIGTEKEPIIFTSNKPAFKKEPGDWGGIVLMGNAKVNTLTGKSTLTQNLKKVYCTFGGLNEEDNSGVLRYIRIEFAGPKVAHSEESASLMMAGIGSGSAIDHIQVSSPFDDAFSWIGGNVNAKNLVSVKCKDDDFDVTMGYTGKIQFCIALKPKMGDFFTTSVLEVHGYENPLNFNKKQSTNCIFSNITAISSEVIKEPFNEKITKYAIHIANSGIVGVYNSLFLGGFQYAIGLQGKEVIDNAADGSININYNIFSGAGRPIGGTKSSTLDLNTWYAQETVSNLYHRNLNDALVQDPFGKNPNMQLSKDNFILNNGANFFNIESNQYKQKFRAENTKYAGAFKNEDWTKKWVNYQPNSTIYPNSTFSVADNISFNTTWTKDKVYVLLGTIEVNNGAILTIEPGTIIKGDYDSKACLIITPNCKIIAKGTLDKPIVFTSSQAQGERKNGDWGGLVIAGNDKINTSSFSYDYTKLPKSYRFGGTTRNEDSGILKYVRIEFAGGKANERDPLTALTLVGVENLTMDHVQVANSGGSSFEWIGGRSKSSYLVSSKCVDNDFVPTYGFSGIVQYGLAVRDALFAGGGKANGIKSYGSEEADANYWPTAPKFYNFTLIGPVKDKNSQYNQNYQAAAYLTNNSALSIYNSVLLGFPIGLYLEGTKVEFNATSKLLMFKNNFITSCTKPLQLELNSKWDIKTWSKLGNVVLNNETEMLKLKSPYASDMPNFTLGEGSPCLVGITAQE